MRSYLDRKRFFQKKRLELDPLWWIKLENLLVKINKRDYSTFGGGNYQDAIIIVHKYDNLVREYIFRRGYWVKMNYRESNG